MFQTITNELRKRRIEFSCDKHGVYVGEVICSSTNTPFYTPRCPECEKEAEAQRQKEWELHHEEWERAAEEERKKKAYEAYINQLRSFGIPEEYLTKTLAQFVVNTDSDRKALNLTRRFLSGWAKAQEGGYGLLFLGSCGTGKTHLACSAMRELAQRDPNYYFRYARVMDLIREYRETWGREHGGSESEAIRSYASPDLLVLDELGVQAGSVNEQQILFAVLDRRITNKKPTILISNLNKKDLQVLLGERLFDRIQSKCVPCVFTGKSHRKPATEEVFG